MSAITSNVRSVSLRQAAAVIEQVAKHTILGSEESKLTQSHHNVFISGPPGVAKSSIVASICAKLGIDLIDLRLCTMEASEVSGIPYTDVEGEEKLMRFSTPEWWPDGSQPTIILLDELPNATPSTQTAALRLLQERTIQNGNTLPDNVMFVALGNRREDRTGARPLLATVSNRFSTQLEIDPKNPDVRNDWVDWAWENGVDSSILAFLDFKKDYVYQPAPSGEGPFPSFRSWTASSDHMKIFGEGTFEVGENRTAKLSSLLHSTIAGAVGSAAAGEYMAFREHWSSLPDWAAVKRGDFSYQLERGNPAVQYALAASSAGHIYDLLIQDYKTNPRKYEEIENICHYLSQCQLDMLVVFYRTIRRIDEKAYLKILSSDMISRPDTGEPSTLLELVEALTTRVTNYNR